MQRLAKPPGWLRRRLGMGPRLPSHIPARAFALTLIETATRDTEPHIGVDLVAKAQQTVEKIGVPPVQAAAAAGLTHAQRAIDAVRAEIERAFDQVMDRASGWYKRYVQWWLAALAVAVAVGLNVNAFTVAERLWKDDALRTAVVQQAQQSVGEATPQSPQSATPKDVAAQVDDIDEFKVANRLGRRQYSWEPLGQGRGLARHGGGNHPRRAVLV